MEEALTTYFGFALAFFAIFLYFIVPMAIALIFDRNLTLWFMVTLFLSPLVSIPLLLTLDLFEQRRKDRELLKPKRPTVR